MMIELNKADAIRRQQRLDELARNEYQKALIDKAYVNSAIAYANYEQLANRAHNIKSIKKIISDTAKTLLCLLAMALAYVLFMMIGGTMTNHNVHGWMEGTPYPGSNRYDTMPVVEPSLHWSKAGSNWQ